MSLWRLSGSDHKLRDHCPGVWDTSWGAEGSIWLIMGICRGGTRGRRGGDQGGLRRSKRGKTARKAHTRGWRGVSRG